MNPMRKTLVAIAVLCASPAAFATYTTTGFLDNLDITMDNGVTYLTGFTTYGTCAYNRLELRKPATTTAMSRTENACTR